MCRDLVRLALCPDGVEATLFAMNMGLSNFGATVGGYMGNGLMWLLGVQAPVYNNLGLFVIIRSIMRLLPLLLIPILVPDGSPATENSEEEEEEVTQDDEPIIPEDSTPLMQSTKQLTQPLQ